MKAQFLDRSVGLNSSIALQEHTGKYFKKLWHYHPEVELMVVREGTGSLFVGDSIEKFEPGVIVLIGSNLPHLWQNDEAYFAAGSGMKVRSLSIHFNEDFAGNLLSIPEMNELYRLLQRAKRGIKFIGQANRLIIESVEDMFGISGYERIISFLDILKALSGHQFFKFLSSSGYMDIFREIQDTKMLPVYEYIMNHFKEDITLTTVAELAHMNPSSFSRYFTSVQKKTLTRFINEIRIGYACKLLIDGNYNISGACFESGFNNLSNFNRQFRLIKNMAPSEFISRHAERADP